MLERRRACALRYRQFALSSRHFYAIMFEDAIPHERNSPEVAAHGGVALELKNLVQTPDPAATYRAAIEAMLRGLASR